MTNTLLSHIGALARRCGGWTLALLLALTVWSWSAAQSQLDKMQALAQERYGPVALESVIAWRKLMEEARNLPEDEKLKAVNVFFNRRIRYVSDQEVWGQTDYWASPLEFMGKSAGDCEDYAIAKYMSLQMIGVSPDKLRMIYVRARFGGANSTNSEAHMVLGYYANPNDEPLILDSLVGSIRPAASRTDLLPIFSFNTQGLWVGGATSSAADPTARLSQWRAVVERMKQEGLNP
jgi:predicted transglutaminase-like cysteine proteinase